MRRAHRSMHLVLWVLLAPAVAAAAWIALSHRTDDPVVDAPDAVVSEAP